MFVIELMKRKIMSDIHQLGIILDQMEGYLPRWEKVNSHVSSASVGWHIEHTAMTTSRIIGAVKTSDPSAYERKFNWARAFVFLTNRIPRGKGKAPQSVLPGDISDGSIRRQLQAARIAMDGWEALQAHHHFDHPYFGKVAREDAARFLRMHARHHLKIIRDIMK
jgi:hypothetical protein